MGTKIHFLNTADILSEEAHVNATASASAASSCVIGFLRPSNIFTIRCSCPFSARPYPVTLCLTYNGVNSKTGTRA